MTVKKIKDAAKPAKKTEKVTEFNPADLEGMTIQEAIAELKRLAGDEAVDILDESDEDEEGLLDMAGDLLGRAWNIVTWPFRKLYQIVTHHKVAAIATAVIAALAVIGYNVLGFANFFVSASNMEDRMAKAQATESVEGRPDHEAFEDVNLSEHEDVEELLNEAPSDHLAEVLS